MGPHKKAYQKKILSHSHYREIETYIVIGIEQFDLGGY